MKRRDVDSIIQDALASPRLNAWERDFIENIAKIGLDFHLTNAQAAKLKQIEEKIYATG